MSIPLVSVVMPTHNRAGFLKEAIASALAQTIREIELIVVDDASTDETAALLTELSRTDSRIKVVTNPVSLGGGGARNVGISVSSGEWVAFLDDDDAWAGNKLEIQLEKLRAVPSAVACSCAYEQVFASGSSRVMHLPEAISLEQLMHGSYMGGASMCICSREVLARIGGFDTSFRSGQDWDLWVRLRMEGDIAVCNEPLVRYLAHDGARISNNMDAQYLGARRFYFKHRSAMSDSIREFRVSYCCYIMSRQPKRASLARLKYLRMSLKHAGLRVGLSYVMSSLPRLLRDCFRLR